MDRNAYSREDTCCRIRTSPTSRRATFPTLNRAKATLLRRDAFFVRQTTESPRSEKNSRGDGERAYPADLFGILLWLHMWPENGPTLGLQKAIPSPARRSLYKFHESFEPYIFSLSSRFARHVLLKYDNFTRVGRPSASLVLLVLSFFLPSTIRYSTARSTFLLLFTSIFAQIRYIFHILPPSLTIIYQPRYDCMLILLITRENFQSSPLNALARMVQSF